MTEQPQRTPQLSPGDSVIFHEHIPQGAGADPIVIDRAAVVIGYTADRCAICGEGVDHHDRPNRRHAFELDMRPLLDLVVTFPAHPPYHPAAEQVTMRAIPYGDRSHKNTWRNA